MDDNFKGLTYLEDGTIAYEEGRRAYQEDAELTDNPYDRARKNALFEDWKRGWIDALEEAEDIDH